MHRYLVGHGVILKNQIKIKRNDWVAHAAVAVTSCVVAPKATTTTTQINCIM